MPNLLHSHIELKKTGRCVNSNLEQGNHSVIWNGEDELLQIKIFSNNEFLNSIK